MATSVHIYALSKLVHASPGNWEKQLAEIERGKRRAYSYYLPLREAVVAYCKSKGRRYDEIVEELQRRAAEVIAPRGANPVKDNVVAFDRFVDQFYPRIEKFNKSLLKTDTEGGCEFEGLRLLGTPHFSAVDKDGRERYVFLLSSKWDEDDLKAYLELLSVLVGRRFNASPNRFGAWIYEPARTTSGKARRACAPGVRRPPSYSHA